MPRVTVHYFAILREKKNCATELVEIALGEEVGALYERLFPTQGSVSQTIGYAVNQRHSPATTVLHDGDEVAFIPPLGGG
jgi:molybdopterin converting factor small subunit